MIKSEVAPEPKLEVSPEKVREQLELVISDAVFRSSKRSIEFLRYVVEQTLSGNTEQIKERTIGVEVFSRIPSYDTNMDHVVRTAAVELRKRLAIYYGDERHRAELRMSLVPGSYIPRFTYPEPSRPLLAEPEHLPVTPLHLDAAAEPVSQEATAPRRSHLFQIAAVAVVLLGIAAAALYRHQTAASAQDLFWKPIVDAPGSVLLAVGDVPNGPPTTTDPDSAMPMLHAPTSPTVPFADAVTIARVMGVLGAHGKKVLIRRESVSSFDDLREGPAVLVGAFNNEWSLRLTHQLRYTLALDSEKHLIYIRDLHSIADRTWSWRTDQPTSRRHGASGPTAEDFALISRIWNSDTGHMVLVIGGLYTYGTQTAGEFLTDPQYIKAVEKAIPSADSHKNLQIVLGTTVTDDTPGPPRVLAVSVE
jgi:hypothetical protein